MNANNRKRRGGFNRGGPLGDMAAQLKQRLENFIQSNDEELILEPMEKEKRKILHGLIWKMGLRAVSKGKEPNRYMIISRRRTDPLKHIIDAQFIDLTIEQNQAIRRLIHDYPIENWHVQNYLNLENYKDNRKSNKKSPYQGPMRVPQFPKPNRGMESFRQKLPAYQMRFQILDAINRNQVTLITGGTGCGKTTQVPQFLLENAAHSRTPIRIICTQPRRLPAIAVSSRVAKERGEEHGRTVGYHIRLEQNTSQETVLTYCTSGILLRMLTADAVSSNISHIILDEIHERELNTDYLLIALKQALKSRKDLKVILMSATMEGNKEMFLNYFEDARIGHVEIPSRLYDVEKFYLPDILALTGHVSNNQNIVSCDISPKIPRVSEFNGIVKEDQNLSNLRWDKITASVDQQKPQTSMDLNWSQITIDQPEETSKPSICTQEPGKPIIFNVSQHLNEQIPDRPPFFNPNYTQRLLNAGLDRQILVQKYYETSGIEWCEGVDPELVASVVKYLMDSPVIGSILVFLPGYEDILAVNDKIIENEKNFKTRPMIYTLHSQMNSGDQQKVFDAASNGTRKVILSTNIAEASLTIDDVVFVVDCGKVKEKSYDHESRISQLKVQWIAKSNAEQRSGRAGRCRNGFCFRLYTQEQHDVLDVTQNAEMKRAAIHEVCLHVKIFAPENVTVREFLEMAPEPPTSTSIANSLEFLEQLGALYLQDDTTIPEEEEARISYKFFNPNRDTNVEPELSRLGRLVAHMPLEPQLARLLLFGLELKCLDPILTLVAALSHRDPFILPASEDARRVANSARDEFARLDYSDHLMLMRAFYEYCKCSNYNQANNFCKSKFLSFAGMKMIYGIRLQLWNELKRLHLVPQNVRNFDDYEVNYYSSSWPMIQTAILAGCYPGVGVAKDGSKMRKIRTCAQNNASFHPSSVLKRQIVDPSKRSEQVNRFSNNIEPKIEFLAYQELIKLEEGITLRMVTACIPLAVLILAGTLHMSKNVIDGFKLTDKQESLLKNNEFLIEIESWLAMQGKFEDLQLIMRLRFKLMFYFLEFLKNPTSQLSREHNDLLACLNYVLSIDHHRFGFQML